MTRNIRTTLLDIGRAAGDGTGIGHGENDAVFGSPGAEADGRVLR